MGPIFSSAEFENSALDDAYRREMRPLQALGDQLGMDALNVTVVNLLKAYGCTDAAARSLRTAFSRERARQARKEAAGGLVGVPRNEDGRPLARVVSGDASRPDDRSLLDMIADLAADAEEPDFTALHYDLATVMQIRLARPLVDPVHPRRSFTAAYLRGLGDESLSEQDWVGRLDPQEVHRRLQGDRIGSAAVQAVVQRLSGRGPAIRSAGPFVTLVLLRAMFDSAPSWDRIRDRIAGQAVGGNAANGGRANNARRALDSLRREDTAA